MVAPKPINWETVKNALVAWINGVSGLTTIWENQTGPQPGFPYATLNITSGPTPEGGVDELRYVQEGTPPNVILRPQSWGLRVFTLSVNTFSDTKATTNAAVNSALDYASLIQSSLAFEDVLLDLSNAGLALVSKEPMRNLSFLMTDRYAERWQADYIFRVTFEATQPSSGGTGYIKKAEVSSSTDTDSDVEITEEQMGDLS